MSLLDDIKTTSEKVVFILKQFYIDEEGDEQFALFSNFFTYFEGSPCDVRLKPIPVLSRKIDPLNNGTIIKSDFQVELNNKDRNLDSLFLDNLYINQNVELYVGIEGSGNFYKLFKGTIANVDVGDLVKIKYKDLNILNKKVILNDFTKYSDNNVERLDEYVNSPKESYSQSVVGRKKPILVGKVNGATGILVNPVEEKTWTPTKIWGEIKAISGHYFYRLSIKHTAASSDSYDLETANVPQWEVLRKNLKIGDRVCIAGYENYGFKVTSSVFTNTNNTGNIGLGEPVYDGSTPYNPDSAVQFINLELEEDVADGQFPIAGEVLIRAKDGIYSNTDYLISDNQTSTFEETLIADLPPYNIEVSLQHPDSSDANSDINIKLNTEHGIVSYNDNDNWIELVDNWEWLEPGDLVYIHLKNTEGYNYFAEEFTVESYNQETKRITFVKPDNISQLIRKQFHAGLTGSNLVLRFEKVQKIIIEKQEFTRKRDYIDLPIMSGLDSTHSASTAMSLDSSPFLPYNSGANSHYNSFSHVLQTGVTLKMKKNSMFQPLGRNYTIRFSDMTITGDGGTANTLVRDKRLAEISDAYVYHYTKNSTTVQMMKDVINSKPHLPFYIDSVLTGAALTFNGTTKQFWLDDINPIIGFDANLQQPNSSSSDPDALSQGDYLKHPYNFTNFPLANDTTGWAPRTLSKRRNYKTWAKEYNGSTNYSFEFEDDAQWESSFAEVKSKVHLHWFLPKNNTSNFNNGDFSPTNPRTGLMDSRSLWDGDLNSHTLNLNMCPQFFTSAIPSSSVIYGIGIQSTGKIILIGDFGGYFGNPYQNSPHVGIIRLNPDGSIDNTFLSGCGFMQAAFGSAIASVVIDAGDRIIIGGKFAGYDNKASSNIIRLNPDGTVDETFVVGAGFNDTVRTLAYDPVLNIIFAAGSFTSYKGITVNRIARLGSTGTLDSSYNTNVGTGFNGPVFKIYKDWINGGMLAVGGFTAFKGNTRNRIVRLTNGGLEDGTFSAGTGIGGVSPQGLTIGQLSTGEYIVGGQFETYNGTAVKSLIKVGATGTLDATFNTNILSWMTGTFPAVLDLDNVGGDNNIYIVATNGVIAKLSSTGVLDTTFSSNIGTGFPSGQFARSIKYNSIDGKFIVAGEFISFNGASRISSLRISDTGVLDTTFKNSYSRDKMWSGTYFSSPSITKRKQIMAHAICNNLNNQLYLPEGNSPQNLVAVPVYDGLKWIIRIKKCTISNASNRLNTDSILSDMKQYMEINTTKKQVANYCPFTTYIKNNCLYVKLNRKGLSLLNPGIATLPQSRVIDSTVATAFDGNRGPYLNNAFEMKYGNYGAWLSGDKYLTNEELGEYLNTNSGHLFLTNYYLMNRGCNHVCYPFNRRMERKPGQLKYDKFPKEIGEYDVLEANLFSYPSFNAINSEPLFPLKANWSNDDEYEYDFMFLDATPINAYMNYGNKKFYQLNSGYTGAWATEGRPTDAYNDRKTELGAERYLHKHFELNDKSTLQVYYKDKYADPLQGFEVLLNIFGITDYRISVDDNMGMFGFSIDGELEFYKIASRLNNELGIVVYQKDEKIIVEKMDIVSGLATKSFNYFNLVEFKKTQTTPEFSAVQIKYVDDLITKTFKTQDLVSPNAAIYTAIGFDNIKVLETLGKVNRVNAQDNLVRKYTLKNNFVEFKTNNRYLEIDLMDNVKIINDPSDPDEEKVYKVIEKEYNFGMIEFRLIQIG